MPSPVRSHTGSSEAVEDYAKAVYALQRRDGAVGTSDIATRLGVSPAAVSAMVKRMAEAGLLAHDRYRGVRLTCEGERLALEVLRHHRLLELYLFEHLDVPWDEVHEEAEVLEHVISERLEQKIAAKLGFPSHDPHGAPIPTLDGRLDEAPAPALAELPPGTHGRLVEVPDDAGMLRFLSDAGVALHDRVEILGEEPFGGGVRARFGDGPPRTFGPLLAGALRVAVDA